MLALSAFSTRVHTSCDDLIQWLFTATRSCVSLLLAAASFFFWIAAVQAASKLLAYCTLALLPALPHAVDGGTADFAALQSHRTAVSSPTALSIRRLFCILTVLLTGVWEENSAKVRLRSECTQQKGIHNTRRSQATGYRTSFKRNLPRLVERSKQ